MKKNTKKYKLISKFINSEGGLYDVGRYISWEVWDKKACLDGHFTKEELRDIASFMEEHEEA